MEWLFMAIVIIVLMVIAKKKHRKETAFKTPPIIESPKIEEPAAEETKYPYIAIPQLFTPAERSFLGVLDQAIGEKVRIFGKVRIADVLKTERGLNKSEKTTALNRINRKHFDFVICDKNDLSILCAVELDDKSHNQKDRQERDEFVVNACKAAGVRMIQVPARAGYTISDVADLFDGIIKLNNKKEDETPINNNLKICPKCSAKLMNATKRNGEIKILLCSTYPECKFHIELHSGEAK